MTDDGVVEVSVHVAAQPETVSLSSPTLPATSSGWVAARRWSQSRAARNRVRMGDSVEAAGEFVEIDPPHRVVFT